MRAKLFAAAALAAAGLSLAACEHHLDRSDGLTGHSGAAMRHNAAVHTADPSHREAHDNNIPHSAERLRHSIERYYEGPPKPKEGNAGQSVILQMPPGITGTPGK